MDNLDREAFEQLVGAPINDLIRQRVLFLIESEPELLAALQLAPVSTSES
jgi:hypothetical protein